MGLKDFIIYFIDFIEVIGAINDQRCLVGAQCGFETGPTLTKALATRAPPQMCDQMPAKDESLNPQMK